MSEATKRPRIGVPITTARSTLASIVDRVIHHNERIVIIRHKRDRVALVPAADLERLEALDDQEDIEAADKALAESDKRIPYDEIRQELGL